MDSECCIQKAALKIGKISVKGQLVGIRELTPILEKAHGSGLEGRALLQELLRLTGMYNYIPSSVEEEYAEALLGSLQSYRMQRPVMVLLEGDDKGSDQS